MILRTSRKDKIRDHKANLHFLHMKYHGLSRVFGWTCVSASDSQNFRLHGIGWFEWRLLFLALLFSSHCVVQQEHHEHSSTSCYKIRECAVLMFLFFLILLIWASSCGTITQLGLGRLVVEFSRWHRIRHTQPVGLLSTSDQLVAETTTYTTHD
jgi:hypothetical protein